MPITTNQPIIHAIISQESIEINSKLFLDFFYRTLDEYFIATDTKDDLNQLIINLEKYVLDINTIHVDNSIEKNIAYDCIFCLFLLIKVKMLSASSKDLPKYISHYLKIYKKNLKQTSVFFWYFKYFEYFYNKSFNFLFSALHTYNNLLEHDKNIYKQIVSRYESLFHIDFKPKWKPSKTPQDNEVPIFIERIANKKFDYVMSYSIDLDNQNHTLKMIDSVFTEEIKNKVLVHLHIKNSGITIHPSSTETLTLPNMLVTQKSKCDKVNSSLLQFLFKKYEKPVIKTNLDFCFDYEKLLSHVRSLQHRLVDIAHYNKNNPLEKDFIPHSFNANLISFYNFTNQTQTYLALADKLNEHFTSNANFKHLLINYSNYECSRREINLLNNQNIDDLPEIAKKTNSPGKNLISLAKNELLVQSHVVQAGKYSMNIEFLFPLEDNEKLLVQIENPEIEPKILADSLGIKYNSNLKSACLHFGNNTNSRTLIIPESIKNLDIKLVNKNSKNKIFINKFELRKEQE